MTVVYRRVLAAVSISVALVWGCSDSTSDPEPQTFAAYVECDVDKLRKSTSGLPPGDGLHITAQWGGPVAGVSLTNTSGALGWLFDGACWFDLDTKPGSVPLDGWLGGEDVGRPALRDSKEPRSAVYAYILCFDRPEVTRSNGRARADDGRSLPASLRLRYRESGKGGTLGVEWYQPDTGMSFSYAEYAVISYEVHNCRASGPLLDIARALKP